MAKTADEAKAQAEAKTKATKAKIDKTKAANSAQIEALKKTFGPVGTENEGELIVDTNEYQNLIVSKNTYGSDGQYTGRYEVFFWIAPDGIDYKQKNASGVIKEIKLLYRNNPENLRKILFDKNFMSETDYLTKDETALNNAIILAGRNHSVSQAQTYTLDGATSFLPFDKWLSGLGNRIDENRNAYPRRDIDLQDRDVVENIVKGVYRNVTDNEIDDELLKQETDRYMNQIKKGSLTTYEKSGKENVFETTKRFSAEQVAAELPETIDKERPGAKDAKTSFDFLAWMSNLGGQF